MNQGPAEHRVGELRNLAVASILDVTSEFMHVEDLDALLQKIAKAVSETFGLAKVHIGIKDKETGLFVVRAVYGYDPDTEGRLKNVKYSPERMRKDLRPELMISRKVYYITAESWEPDEEDLMFIARPERIDEARASLDDWHECDYMDFMMYEKDGTELGYLEIDEPENGKVPSEETIEAIEVFSDLAAIAIQNAALYQKLTDDRRKIELLLDLIGHDVNNYAQGVSGFIELAMSRPDIPLPARKSLAKAHDQVLNLNKLVRNVSIYAKVESIGDRNLRPVDILETVKEAFNSAQSSSRNKEVKMMLTDDGTKKLFRGNDLAKDIFLNLFSNAIKFDNHENILVEVKVEERIDKNIEYWCVSVADRGPGIDDAIKTSIFDRFTQGSNMSIGTGLGLYIARTLVETYKGKIWVEDRVKGDRSEGSVFNVLLPKYTGWMPRSDT